MGNEPLEKIIITILITALTTAAQAYAISPYNAGWMHGCYDSHLNSFFNNIYLSQHPGHSKEFLDGYHTGITFCIESNTCKTP